MSFVFVGCMLDNISEAVRMFLAKQVSRDKKKRLSQSKTAQRRPTFSNKKNYPHNRSSSMQRDKKQLRLHTDYDHSDASYSHHLQPYPKQYKKLAQRRDTYDCQALLSWKPPAVQSTKHNTHKNIELKSMFRSSKDQRKPKGCKGRNNNHPFLKFISKRQERDKQQSPYTRPSHQTRYQSQHSEHSISIGKARGSVTKKPHILLQKAHINLKPDTGSRQIPHQKTQKVELQERVRKRQIRGRQDEQSTVKTIKKQREEEEEISESQRSNQSFGLTEEEEGTFGDRFPYGFEKVKLLGRGGFSLVWLGRHVKSGREFAIKQIITQNTHQTHIKQIWFGTMFFTLGGVPKPEFANFPGVKNLVRLYSYEINQTDTWIFYEKCGLSLGSGLYDIRSQKVYGQQKLYKIHNKPLYQAMAANPSILTKLVIQICKALALLSECEIVHSDLKTENILIRTEKDGKETQLKEVKLIDYGSSFEFRNIAQFSMATPEYMPPQILNYIIHENQGQYEEDLYQKVMTDYRSPWAIDMWSLGCVLLEIVVGVPLWMSLPLLVPGRNGVFLQKEGLFAVKGRLFPEIIAKQRSVNPHLDQILDRQNYSRIVVSPSMQEVIKAMLDIDFNKRISPTEVISKLEGQLND